MRFISRLFQRGPRRDDWLKISTEITGGFETDAKNFFHGVVRSIDECPKWPGGEVLCPVHRTLGGKAEIAIKTHELTALSGLLDAMEYHARPQGRNFCDLV